jgi:hypothetical protein
MKRSRSPIEARLRREYLRHRLSEHALSRRWLRRFREGASTEELAELRLRMREARGAMVALGALLDDIAMGRLEAA